MCCCGYHAAWRVLFRLQVSGLVEDAVHRGDQRDGNEANDESHEDDDQRLEERREFLELVLQLTSVVLRSVVELNIERSRILTDAHHLRGGLGKQSGIG